MKSMKGRFVQKLKLFKHGLVSEINNSADKFLNQSFQISSLYVQEDHHYKEKLTAFSSSSASSCNDRASAMDKFEVSSEIITAEHDNTSGEAENETVNYSSLSHFQEKCPPGGNQAVILYTTSLRSIRKTFEDCHTILFLLQSFKVKFYERDVSMHMEFREELWKILGGRVIPPRLFIKGRYIGGADEVVSLHEQGKLRKLLEGVPLVVSNTPCSGCGNKRFVVCFNCNGCRKVFVDRENHEEMFARCQECNENGLVKCSICS